MKEYYFYFASPIVAGVFMAKLATKFGFQATMSTLNTGYEIVANLPYGKHKMIEAYADGLRDGMNVLADVK